MLRTRKYLKFGDSLLTIETIEQLLQIKSYSAADRSSVLATMAITHAVKVSNAAV
jgi:hypothetical protein